MAECMSYVAWFQSWQNLEERNKKNWMHGMGSFCCYMRRGLGIRLDWAGPVSDISPHDEQR